MTEHYTQSTVGVTKWCNVCRKQTIHDVSGKRLGKCIEHGPASQYTKRQERVRKKIEQEEREPRLL